MAKRRRGLSAPTEVVEKYRGRESCSWWSGNPARTRVKICVRGGRYGFSAELVGRTGGRLPISIPHDVRTPRAAMREAKNFMLRHHYDSHGNPRR